MGPFGTLTNGDLNLDEELRKKKLENQMRQQFIPQAAPGFTPDPVLQKDVRQDVVQSQSPLAEAQRGYDVSRQRLSDVMGQPIPSEVDYHPSLKRNILGGLVRTFLDRGWGEEIQRAPLEKQIADYNARLNVAKTGMTESRAALGTESEVGTRGAQTELYGAQSEEARALADQARAATRQKDWEIGPGRAFAYQVARPYPIGMQWLQSTKDPNQTIPAHYDPNTGKLVRSDTGEPVQAGEWTPIRPGAPSGLKVSDKTFQAGYDKAIEAGAKPEDAILAGAKASSDAKVATVVEELDKARVQTMLENAKTNRDKADLAAWLAKNQDYGALLELLQVSPNSISKVTGKQFQGLVGYANERGKPVPAPVSAQTQNLESAATRTQTSLNRMKEILNSPGFVENIGPVVGRLGKAGISFGDISGMDPEMQQTFAEFNTLAMAMLAQEAQTATSGRGGPLMMQALADMKANPTKARDIMIGTFKGIQDAVNSSKEGVRKERYGGQTPPVSNSSEERRKKLEKMMSGK
jgi:hypothetical protein